MSVVSSHWARVVLATLLVVHVPWVLYTLGAFGVPIPVLVAAAAALVALALSPLRERRWALLLFLLPAVVLGAVLVGPPFDPDPCGDRAVTEGVAAEEEWRWWPPRPDCRIAVDGGADTIVRGEGSGFLAVFGLGLLLTALAVLVRGRVVARVAAGVVATVAVAGFLFS